MKPLTVQGDLTSIDQLAEYVATAATLAGLDHRAAYCLRLAVDEIATNIITHGYQNAGLTGDLTVTADLRSDQLIIQLEDNGAIYDPRQTPPPDNLDQPLNKRKAGHLGVFLALWGIDGFTYERIHDHNRSAFVMQRPQEKAAA